MILGSNPGGSKNFLCIFVQTGPEAHQPPVPWIPGLFPRDKAARAWCDHLPSSIAEIMHK